MTSLDIIALPGHPGMFARRVAVQAWQRAGSPRVNSAGRLYALQKHFWDGWRKRIPGFNPADNPDDETQRLAHVRFVAFDIDPTPDRIRRLTAAGLIRPYWYEAWHWELPNVRSYSIVRSIPATAGGTITPILEELEHDMIKLYCETPDSSGRNHYLVGEFTWQALSLPAAQEEWDRDGDVIGVDPATRDRFKARTMSRRAELLAELGQPAIDYDKVSQIVALAVAALPPATITPAAIAKAVNDDAAARLKS